MGEVVIAAPLRVEARAVRHGAAGVRVVRTGMGMTRSLRSRPRLAGPPALVVMGLAGGLAPEVEVGDVVVGSEVRDGAKATACINPDGLAADLRALGHRVHVGPIVTVDKLVRGRSRAELAASGALAVDMESAYLLADWPGRRVGVVRIVSDTAAAPILRPGMVTSGIRCLRTLRMIAVAVECWAGEGRRKEQSGAGDAKG